MRKSISKYVALTASAMLFLSGCGNSAANQPTPQNQTSLTIQGPIDPMKYAQALSGGSIKQLSAVVSMDDSKVGVNKTSADGAGTTDAGAVLGMVAVFAPEAAPILIPLSIIAGLFGADAGANATAIELAQIQTQLATMQNQINQLQYGLMNTDATLQNTINQVSASSFCTAFQNWDSALQNIYTTPSNEYNTTQSNGATGSINFCLGTNIGSASGIGNQFFTLLQNNSDLNATAKNTVSMQGLNQLTTNLSGYITAISATNGLSESSLTSNADVVASYGQVSGVALKLNTNSSNCTTSTSGGLDSTLQCALAGFKDSQIPSVQTQGSNIVPNLNSYNNMLTMIYQNSLMGLQYAFAIEAVSNYLNYINYINSLNGGTLSQIAPWEGGAGAITFSVGSDSGQVLQSKVSTKQLATQYFVAAELNLVAVYAARVNNLYKNVMSFLISDAPIQNVQSYTAPQSSQKQYITSSGIVTVTYNPQQSMYTTVQASNLTSTLNQEQYIPGSAAYPTTTANGYMQTQNGVFYQYNGINNLYSCVGKDKNATTCTSAFSGINSSYYDGSTLQGYYVNTSSNNAITLMQPGLNVNYCIMPNNNSNGGTSSYPILWTSGGSGNLICGNWGGWGANGMVNGSTMLNASSNSAPTLPTNLNNVIINGIPPSGNYYGLGTSNYTWFDMSHNPNNDYTYYTVQNAPTYTLIASTTSTGYGYGNGEFYNGCSDGNYQCLTDGGFSYSSGSPYMHTALLQVQMPNGYIMPFYIFSYIAYDNAIHDDAALTYSSPICPSTMGLAGLPGMQSCTQQNGGNGGIQVSFWDGNTYYINVLQPSTGQGMQYGYLQISTSAQTSCTQNGTNVCSGN